MSLAMISQIFFCDLSSLILSLEFIWAVLCAGMSCDNSKTKVLVIQVVLEWFLFFLVTPLLLDIQEKV
ncbi:unnamed protein product [Blepharisma stoltei]|uniref:Uncharacterized protein n=1 Tax=Blepharisma stoltei TaxID=1481888 RepID=A0AAU9IUV1_9CILI|nr:unnamed protein product [Blepharisma stoltei]